MKRIPLTLAGIAALATTPILLATPSELGYPTSIVLVDEQVVEPPSIDEAHALQRAGRYDQAIDAWSAIVEHDPESHVAIFNLGYCLHMRGRLEEAIEYHARAAESDQFRGIALYNLGCAHALLGNTDTSFQMLALAQEHGFDVGDRIFSDSDLESLRNDPRIARFTGQEIRQAESHQHQEEAQVQDDRGSERKRRFAALAKRFAKEAAREMGPMAMEKLSEKYPDMAPMINQVGPMVMQSLNGGEAPPMTPEQRAAAEQQAEQAVVQMQHQLSGAVSMFSQQAQQTIQMFEYQIQDAIQNDPRVREMLTNVVSDPRFHQVMAAMQQMAQRQQGGQPTAEAAPAGSLEAQLAGALNQARQSAESGDVETSIMIYREILKHVPDHATATFELGYTLHMAGRLDEAIPMHKAATEYEDYRGIAYYNLACAHALQGNREAAFEALNKSHDAGFNVVGSAANDPDFRSLRNDQKFKDLMVLFRNGTDL